MLSEISGDRDITTNAIDYWISYGMIIAVWWPIRALQDLAPRATEVPRFKSLAMKFCLDFIFETVPWFCGFCVDDRTDSPRWYLPYRVNDDGKVKLFVPWEIVFMSFPVYVGMVVWFGIHPNIWVIMAVLSPLLLIRVEATPDQKHQLDL